MMLANKHSATFGSGMLLGLCKKCFFALRAKLYLDGDIFFLILQSKIKKKMSQSK